MEFLIISIIAMIVLRFTKHKEIIRISWDKVAQFCGFLMLLSFVRIASYDFMFQTGVIENFPSVYPEVMAIKWAMVLVFWEDVFFGIPLYFIHKYMDGPKIKYLKWILTIVISALFGSLHAYQGIIGIIATSLVPYFLFYRYGKRHGFGTTMVCHILYDNVTVYTIILLPYLLGSFY